MVFFDEDVKFRMRKVDVKAVRRVLRKRKAKYDSESHFFRTAILRLLREEQDSLISLERSKIVKNRKI